MGPILAGIMKWRVVVHFSVLWVPLFTSDIFWHFTMVMNHTNMSASLVFLLLKNYNLSLCAATPTLMFKIAFVAASTSGNDPANHIPTVSSMLYLVTKKQEDLQMQNKVGQDEQIERKIGSTQKILYFMFIKNLMLLFIYSD